MTLGSGLGTRKQPGAQIVTYVIAQDTFIFFFLSARGGIPAEASIWTLKADCMDVNLMSPTSWGWPSHRFARQGLRPHPWVKPPLLGDNTATQLKSLSNR